MDKSPFNMRANKRMPASEGRNLGRQYLPRSVGGAASGIIQQFNETFVSPSGVVMNNGDVATHIVTVESNSDEFIIADVEWGVFVSADNTFSLSEALLPYLGGISAPLLSDWQIIGPFASVLETSNGSSGNTMPAGKTDRRLILRNISAGTVTVWFVTQIKYIANGGGGGSQ